MKFYLETDRLLIRNYSEKDADAFWNVIKREEIYKTTYAIPKNYPRSRVDWHFEYLKSQAKNKTGFEYGIFDKISGQFIGGCGLINVRKNLHSAAITYFVDPELWGNGYATEATLAMLKLGFLDFGLMRISGTCMTINPASKKVMEKLGFVYEGTGRSELFKDDVFWDVDHLAILKNEFISRYLNS